MRVHSARRGLALAAIVAALAAVAACRRAPDEPLTLERNQLTVDNRSPRDWTDVEIAINVYYRLRVPKIAAGSRFTATLDTFTAGFGQRLDWRRTQIRDLKLTASLPDGRPLELTKQWHEHGLARALGRATGGGQR